MNSRELRRLFQQVLKTTVPVVGLSACGDLFGGHRLTATDDPIIKEDVGTAAQDPMCGDPLWTKANEDPNMKASPQQLVTVREVPSSALDPLQKPVANPDRETCVRVCGGDDRFVNAAVRLTTGELISVGAKVHVDDCEIYTDKSPLQVACQETWTWQLSCFVIGRRPEGFMAGDNARGGDVGAFLAAMAQLEAASVPAFDRLRRELLAHGAPEEFVARAALFAEDEVKHTRMASALARRYGGRPVQAPLPALEVRELEAVLIENAVEGCVRETFGALVGHWQAMHAQDPVVRKAMEVIAEDETRHAAFAWEIEAWARGRLSAATQRRLDDARAAAVREALTLAAEPSAEAAQLLGLPTAAQSHRLAQGLKQTLWV
jgi:hypothetical protein